MEPAHETYSDFITVEEAARQLHKRITTIVRLIEQKELPAVDVSNIETKGREYRIRQVDVDAFARAEHEERLQRASGELGLPTNGDNNGK